MNTEKETYTRREFSQLFLMLMTMFGAAATGRAGVDEKKKITGKKRRQPGFIQPEEMEGITLAIDLPTENGWEIIHQLEDDDWRRIEIDPLDVSPRLHQQLLAAQTAPHGTPVLCRVLGDAVAVLKSASYFSPGELDDSSYGNEEEDYEGEPFKSWRIEWFGDGIKRVPPDNTSWWQHRLKYDPKDRENAFAAQWLHDNDPVRHSYNHGCGIAQDLMLSTYEHEKPKAFEPWLTNRERKILATFVQWLGTNCGQGFLYEVRARGGIEKGLM